MIVDPKKKYSKAELSKIIQQSAIKAAEIHPFDQTSDESKLVAKIKQISKSKPLAIIVVTS